MKKVNKKFFLLLTLYFFMCKIRGLSVVKNITIVKSLIYNVLTKETVTPKMFLNFVTILSASFFLVENSK